MLSKACTMEACAWDAGRTHWYCVQTFGLQGFPMGIIDVLQIEIVVVLAQPGFLQVNAAMKAMWSIQPAALHCRSYGAERGVQAARFLLARCPWARGNIRCAAHACRLQTAHPVMLPCELQALPWNALHRQMKAHWAGHHAAPCSRSSSYQASKHPLKADISLCKTSTR